MYNQYHFPYKIFFYLYVKIQHNNYVDN